MEVRSARRACELAFDVGKILTAFEVAARIGHITTKNDLGEEVLLLF